MASTRYLTHHDFFRGTQKNCPGPRFVSWVVGLLVGSCHRELFKLSVRVEKFTVFMFLMMGKRRHTPRVILIVSDIYSSASLGAEVALDIVSHVSP